MQFKISFQGYELLFSSPCVIPFCLTHFSVSVAPLKSTLSKLIPENTCTKSDSQLEQSYHEDCRDFSRAFHNSFSIAFFCHCWGVTWPRLPQWAGKTKILGIVWISVTFFLLAFSFEFCLAYCTICDLAKQKFTINRCNLASIPTFKHLNCNNLNALFCLQKTFHYHTKVTWAQFLIKTDIPLGYLPLLWPRYWSIVATTSCGHGCCGIGSNGDVRVRVTSLWCRLVSVSICIRVLVFLLCTVMTIRK